MYFGSLVDFGKLSINGLIFRWSEANQELSLELSPQRDSVISLMQMVIDGLEREKKAGAGNATEILRQRAVRERALDPASGWRAAKATVDVAASGEEWLAVAIEEESKVALKVD
ncbi:hypothetical protein B296_00027887 [Ensete ventricosum]|uniref:Uncharacterized protein n=1 Tax=Ensete ventricosum TaxID=4639 RepID=A0A426XUN7_ENSVE|nr:hypothetical protein B296_00027887 [Ensete ventricosum]